MGAGSGGAASFFGGSRPNLNGLVANGAVAANADDDDEDESALLRWPGPPEWSPRDVELPPHLMLTLRARLAAAAAAASSSPLAAVAAATISNNQGLGMAWPTGTTQGAPFPRGGGGPSSAAASAAAGFTPVQCAYLSSVSRVLGEAVRRLPVLWAVVTSAKYGQSGSLDLVASSSVVNGGGNRQRPPGGAGPGGGKAAAGAAGGVGQAARLGQELIGRVVLRLSERAERALEELNGAGPMQPCMELLLMVRGGVL